MIWLGIPRLVAVAMTVLAVDFALRRALDGWVWALDAVVGICAAVYEWLWGTSARWRQALWLAEQPPPTPTGSAADGGAEAVDRGEKVTARDEWYGFFSVTVPVAIPLVVLHYAIDGGFHSRSSVVRLVPIVVLTVYCLHRLFFEMAAPYLFSAVMLRKNSGQIVQEGLHVLAQLFVLLAVLTELFAAWLAFWHGTGFAHSTIGLHGPEAFHVAEKTCLWNLVDAIPLLSVPKTLQWPDPSMFTGSHAGLFVLGYKAVAILPVGAGLIAFARAIWDAEDKQSSSRA